MHEGYSRDLAGTAIRRADLAGRFRIRWLSGIEATGRPGGMISSHILHYIADAPIINPRKVYQEI